MSFKNFATAVLLSGLSLGASAAWVPYSVSSTFADGGTLTGTINVNPDASCGSGIGDMDLVSSATSGFAGAAYSGPSNFSSCGPLGVASFEDESTPGGTFLGLYLTATMQLQQLLPTYAFSTISFESRSVNGQPLSRQLIAGGMSRVSTVTLPGTLALTGLALVLGAGLRAFRARA